MTNDDQPNFVELMTGVAELYSKKMSTTLLNIYWRALERFDFSRIKTAVTIHVNHPDNGQFMVKPADIVRILEGRAETRALHALSKVESAVRHLGSYTSVAFDDPIIHAVIDDMGGWVKFCTCKSNEVPFQANEFMKRYCGYFQRKLTRYPSYLVGTEEHSNKLYDYNYRQQPVLIGDKEQAKQVIQQGNGSTITIHREHLQLNYFAEDETNNSKNLGENNENK